MKTLGLIVNPIAGIGGKVALKGSDGAAILDKARQLGARPESPARAVQALKAIGKLNSSIQVVTWPGEMGEQECLEVGLTPTVIGSIAPAPGRTTAQDTQNAAHEMAAKGVDLLLFAGGDGTARDICNAIGNNVPALGIPAGVKIHSAVYAVTPRSAGEVAAMFLQGRLMNIRDAEVMDIDEEAFRQGIISAKLYGYLRVPEESRYVQSVKTGGIQGEKQALQGIAAEVVDLMDGNDRLFIIGPGTTTRTVMEVLGLDNTLLGIDVVRHKRLVAQDVCEATLLELLKKDNAIIVLTAIGGQGHILGRGNQQLSPAVIRAVSPEPPDNIVVIATKEKLASLCGRPLLVDTSDPQLNAQLSRYIRVITGYGDFVMYKVGY